MAMTRQQLEQQLVAAHRTKNVQAAQQAAYAIRAYDQNVLSAQVPSINAPPPIDRVPKPTFGSWLGNVTAGIGEGLGEQVQGLGGMIERGVTAFAQDPLKASAAAFMTALEPARQGFTQPVQAAKDAGTGIVETGKQMYQQATSGPIGLGQTMGQMIDLPGPSLPGGKRRPTMAELDVYHGTPYTFDPEEGAPLGRFRSEKIGTGEGAQAYGYGLYLAEKQSTAQNYKETLVAKNDNRITLDGEVVDPRSILGESLENLKKIGRQSTIEKLDRYIKANEKYEHYNYDIAFVNQQYRNARNEINTIDESRVTLKEGALYKVDLPDAKIEQMLDWDKPLSEQPQLLDALKRSKNKAVQSVMAQIGDTSKPIMSFGQDLGLEDGQGLMRRLSYALDGRPNSPKASALLQKLGVPGVKYLDAGSRAGEKGTRNFVVFPGEEQSLTILERN